MLYISEKVLFQKRGRYVKNREEEDSGVFEGSVEEEY